MPKPLAAHWLESPSSELVPKLPPWLAYPGGESLFYVAATDLVPEVNREFSIQMAVVFFAGGIGFLVLRTLLPACEFQTNDVAIFVEEDQPRYQWRGAVSFSLARANHAK